ncbi:MAG: metallophosphoesterase family protein [Vicinamibacteraceae bacterium]|nr:metallophosphoesterase family protein [Vicinamibacteraceae bacterium]
MRYLLLSDIHANLEALDAVLRAAPPEDFDALVVLGDIVGYGADPNAVVDRVRELEPDIIIRGNHDKVSSGIEPAEGFNQAARFAALWTHDTLTPDRRAYLGRLPTGPVDFGEIEICHGSPDDEDEYIFEPVDAVEALRGTSKPVCFFGHTHVAIGYWLSQEGFDLIVNESAPTTEVLLDPSRRYLINPGSVGQPRDGDPRAAFGVYDSERAAFAWHRVPYDIEAAQEKIRKAGLPEGLAKRLALGK